MLRGTRSAVSELVATRSLAAALAALEADADALVVANIDRLARALHVQEAVLAKAWAAGARVFSVTDGEILKDDPTDPMRTFVRQVMGAAAQLERGMVVARMQGGRRRLAAAGRHIGGTVPYGSSLADDGALVPVADEQARALTVNSAIGRGLASDRTPSPYLCSALQMVRAAYCADRRPASHSL